MEFDQKEFQRSMVRRAMIENRRSTLKTLGTRHPPEGWNPASPKAGFTCWGGGDTFCYGPVVDLLKFGPHQYGSGMGDCHCGCWMGSMYSGGPVDPFGACPFNPLVRTGDDEQVPPFSDSYVDRFAEKLTGAYKECSASDVERAFDAVFLQMRTESSQ